MSKVFPTTEKSAYLVLCVHDPRTENPLRHTRAISRACRKAPRLLAIACRVGGTLVCWPARRVLRALLSHVPLLARPCLCSEISTCALVSMGLLDRLARPLPRAGLVSSPSDRVISHAHLVAHPVSSCSPHLCSSTHLLSLVPFDMALTLDHSSILLAAVSPLRIFI